LLAGQGNANDVAIATDVSRREVEQGKGLQETIVGRNRYAPLAAHGRRHSFHLLVAAPFFSPDLGQLGARAAELLPQRGGLILGHFRLLPGLGQQRSQLLIVVVQGGGPRLELLILPRHGQLLLLVFLHLSLQDQGILSAAGQAHKP
jgi:hypothetical protein